MVGSHLLVGSGEHKVIALHGWFGSARGWGGLPDLVDGERFSYAFMDYRGYGGAKEQAGEYTMAEVAADAVALADELGWRRFSLVGHSMGGKAAQRVLADVPTRVQRLVGVNPVPAGAVPFDDDGWALFSGAAAEPGNRYAIIDFTTGNRLTRTWIDQMVRHSLDESSEAAFGAYLTAWAKTDFAAELEGNDTPVLVVVGEHDPALGAPVMEQTWLRLFPKARMEVLPDAGHYPMFESPVRLATVIEEFLAG